MRCVRETPHKRLSAGVQEKHLTKTSMRKTRCVRETFTKTSMRYVRETPH